MEAHAELIKRVSDGKATQIVQAFQKFNLGLITRGEFDEVVTQKATEVEKIWQDIKSIPQETIQAVDLYLSR